MPVARTAATCYLKGYASPFEALRLLIERHTMYTYRRGLVVLGALCGFASAAGAQTNPSVDQIIGALKPPPSALHGPTRGIHPLVTDTAVPSDTVPASTAPKPKKAGPTTTAAAMPATEAAAPSVDLYVLFATGSAELTPAAVATLDKLGTALNSSELSGYRFKIEGHTDTVGSEPYNLALSQRRAAAVSAYLEQKFGLAQSRLEIVGVGEADLLVPTPPQTAEPRNRRVKVVNLGA